MAEPRSDRAAPLLQPLATSGTRMEKPKERLRRHLPFAQTQGSVQSQITMPIHLESLKGKK